MSADRESLHSFLNVARAVWLAQGLDRNGLFHERLDFAGRALTPPLRRVMAQARQIFVYCDAALDGFEREGGEVALRALERLFILYSDDGDLSRGLAFALAPDGSIADSRRDSYAHAFVLLALSAAYRLDGDPRHLGRADALDGFVAAHLTDHNHGGLWSCVPPRDRDKLQNPLMHLFEAYLFLHHAAPERPYLKKAGAIARLFRERVFDHAAAALPERMRTDWSCCDSAERHFEPGHHFEWIWLLGCYDAASGENHIRLREALWRTALGAGLDARRRCYDAVDMNHVPARSSVRLWPHTEGVKAACSMMRFDPDRADRLREDMLTALFDLFLNRPFTGGWIDHFDADRPLVDFVPATSLYHLQLADLALQEMYGMQQ
ncbi:MAG: AGE family epimerase/isomerase [Bradyrhizobium sp.]|nr:AGE family epimerase/isomerase [Bradyrhizobium sp.]